MTALAATRVGAQRTGRDTPDAITWDGAACIGHDPEWWFSDVGHGGQESKAVAAEREQDKALAIAICRECPLIDQCRDYITRHPELTAYGIWAGTTAAERKTAAKATGGPVRMCERDDCTGTYQSTSSRRRYCSKRCGDLARQHGKRQADRRADQKRKEKQR